MKNLPVILLNRASTQNRSAEENCADSWEHFVENAVIDEALSAVSDETELSNAAAVGSKYFRQYSNLPLKERLRRTGSRLVSCGYAFDDVKTVLSELAENSEETGNSDEIPDEIEFSFHSAENGADDEE